MTYASGAVRFTTAIRAHPGGVRGLMKEMNAAVHCTAQVLCTEGVRAAAETPSGSSQPIEASQETESQVWKGVIIPRKTLHLRLLKITPSPKHIQ